MLATMVFGDSDPPLDLDDGKVKLGWKTLVSILVAVITVTVGGVITWTRMATKDDVVDGLKANNERLAEMFASKEELKPLSEVPKQLESAQDEILYIRGRIDFIMEQTIIESKRSPATRAAAVKAALKLRAQAQQRGESDPLPGVTFTE
jgi:hypothetical protein